MGHSVASQRAPAGKKPNIVVIYTDDQAFWTLGVSGNKQAYTPNIDRLAREGAFFKNAFITTPVCTPARASMMTSRYASEYNLFDFIPQPGHKLYDAQNPVGLDTASVTFAEVLQASGYATGLVGKWHLGDWTQSADRRFHPTRHGFDYFMGFTGGGTGPKDPMLERDGVVRKFEGLTDDIFTSDAISFIESRRDNPFLLCLHLRSPHAAWLPVAEEDWAPYKDLDPDIPNPEYPDLDIAKVKRKMREYLASTSGVDRNVGRIREALSANGLADNTILIFTSDHGYNMGHNGIEHKGNGKWITKTPHPATANLARNSRPNLYDQSLRVPAIVWWPAVVRPNTIIEEVVSSLDWYPTLVEMAGEKLPPNQIIRGRTLLELLRGKKVKRWNNDLYAEYSMIHYSKAYMRCYRTPEWKLVRDFLDPQRDELYHLAEDPEERNNLINVKTARVERVIKRLDTRMRDQMKANGDPLLKN